MWILLALAAGTLQTARNAFARTLTHEVSPTLNSWARFTFNLPWAALAVVCIGWDASGLVTSPRFFGFCGLCALAQLLGNTALVAALGRASFAESIVLHKLEVVFTAMVGAVFFAEQPSALGWGGIALCAVGTLAINLARSEGPGRWQRAFHFDLGAGLAILCGVLFIGASFSAKEAIAELAALNPALGAGGLRAPLFALMHVTWMEVVLVSAALLIRDPWAFAVVPRHWPTMAAIGFTSWASSVCWFWAFSLTLVAYVRALGQIESVLAVGLGLFVFREPAAERQLPGVALLAAGILLVLLP